MLDYVDKHDQVLGQGSYEEVLSKHLIHRIARIFLFDDSGRLYVQRRSLNMWSDPGAWDQSAAGFVDSGEDYAQAAARELQEELGLTGLPLKFCFKYYGTEANAKYEYVSRFNALFVGKYDSGSINLDPEEVMDGKWITTAELEAWMKDRPDDFTKAFIDVYIRYKQWLKA